VTIETRFEAILAAARDVIARRGFHQASIREIARAAGLSLAGLYHYVGGKDELLFLVVDRGLDRLIAGLDRAGAAAPEAEARLLALVHTHLDYGFRHAAAFRVLNRDWEALPEPWRAEAAAKRQAYLRRGLAVLRALDPHGRPDAELLSATSLLLGMLNGIARRPFLRTADDVTALAAEVTGLFLHGFLHAPGARPARPEAAAAAAAAGGARDA
jgi:AcrR family transcriptional regulator